MVLPMPKGSSYFDAVNLSDERMDFIETISGFWFGTSMPMVPLPGIGAMMRIPIAERLRAISSSRFLMREIRYPEPE
jgi:hypothetical protein